MKRPSSTQVGHGPVGNTLIENLLEERERNVAITVLCLVTCWSGSCWIWSCVVTGWLHHIAPIWNNVQLIWCVPVFLLWSRLQNSQVARCEEPHLAYNRVAMTSYFQHRSAAELSMVNIERLQEKTLGATCKLPSKKEDRPPKVPNVTHIKMSYSKFWLWLNFDSTQRRWRRYS